MIKERLFQLPNEIEDFKITVLHKTRKLEQAKEDTRLWELQELDDISNEVDEKGKAVYSNDTKRKAELERRKTNTQEYIENIEKVKELEFEIAIDQIKLDKLYNEQSNLRAICRLEGGLDG